VREAVAPCERMEDRSETEVCAEGACEHGRIGYGCGVATVAGEGGMGGGGGTRCVFVREREEMLAEGVRVRTGEFTPEATGEGIEPVRQNCPWSFGVGKPDAGTAWADALRAGVVVAATWLPRQARAFQVVVAFEDKAGG